MNETIPCDKAQLDKEIVENQNRYAILSEKDMLIQNPEFLPIDPDNPLWGGLVDDQIEYMLEKVRLKKSTLDIFQFPYLDELGINVKVSFNDLKAMPVAERAIIARRAAIDNAFYLWAYGTNSHLYH